jgi:hypothetical protein
MSWAALWKTVWALKTEISQQFNKFFKSKKYFVEKILNFIAFKFKSVLRLKDNHLIFSQNIRYR